MRSIIALSGILLCFVGGCTRQIPETSDATIYYGGNILTMESDEPSYVESIVERNGKIAFAGKTKEARRHAGEDAVEFDLAGRTLVPGFIDTHVHFSVHGLTIGFHNAVPSDYPNVDAFLDYVSNVVENTPDGEWVVIYGFDRVLVEPYRNLTRHDLDEVTTRNPVVVLYLNLHWATANSRALKHADISKDTPTHIAGGGIFFKDEQGEPTGVVTESALLRLITALPAESGEDAKKDSLREVANFYSSKGITAIADLATGAGSGMKDVLLLQDIAHDKDFPLRVTATPIYQILDRDPLQTAPTEINDIQVLATIKGGRTYYKK